MGGRWGPHSVSAGPRLCPEEARKPALSPAGTAQALGPAPLPHPDGASSSPTTHASPVPPLGRQHPRPWPTCTHSPGLLSSGFHP